jgi:hypothetical protein
LLPGNPQVFFWIGRQLTAIGENHRVPILFSIAGPIAHATMIGISIPGKSDPGVLHVIGQVLRRVIPQDSFPTTKIIENEWQLQCMKSTNPV